MDKEKLHALDQSLRVITEDIRHLKIITNTLRGFSSLNSDHAESIAFAIRQLENGAAQFLQHAQLLTQCVQAITADREHTQEQEEGDWVK